MVSESLPICEHDPVSTFPLWQDKLWKKHRAKDGQY